MYMNAPRAMKKGDKEADMEEKGDEPDNLEMTAPQPQLSGDTKAIQLLKSSEAVKALGSWDSIPNKTDAATGTCSR